MPGPPAASVDLVESVPLFAPGGRELVRLDRQSVSLETGLVDAAWEELLSPGADRHDGLRVGYLLGVETEKERHRLPAALRLKAELYDEVVAPIADCHATEFRFSFFKAAEGQPPPTREGVHYAGYHVDTHTGSTPRLELLRVLVNLHRHPRRFRFAAIDRFELARQGYDIRAGDYRVPALPDSVEDRELEIPAFDGQRISYLTFWASVVPHVGVDEPMGYFLGSYEAVARFRRTVPQSQSR